VVSQWVQTHPGAIDTGYKMLDQILTLLLGTGIFIASLLGFILDNTIPGKSMKVFYQYWRIYNSIN